MKFIVVQKIINLYTCPEFLESVAVSPPQSLGLQKFHGSEWEECGSLCSLLVFEEEVFIVFVEMTTIKLHYINQSIQLKEIKSLSNQTSYNQGKARLRTQHPFH